MVREVHDLPTGVDIWLVDIGLHQSKSHKHLVAHPILQEVLRKYAVQKDKLHHNLSYSHTKMAIAVSDQPVGIDLEFINTTFDYEDVAKECFSNEELASLKNHELFFKSWTRKEALLKATKLGIIEEMALIPSMDGTHEIPAPLKEHGKDWKVYTLTTNGYQLSVASVYFLTAFSQITD